MILAFSAFFALTWFVGCVLANVPPLPHDVTCGEHIFKKDQPTLPKLIAGKAFRYFESPKIYDKAVAHPGTPPPVDVYYAYSFEHKTCCAIKVTDVVKLEPKSMNQKELETEIAVMEAVKNDDRAIKIFDSSHEDVEKDIPAANGRPAVTRTYLRYFIAMEYGGRSLKDEIPHALAHFTPLEVVEYGRHVLSQVKAFMKDLHKKGYTHGDMHGGNFVVASERGKTQPHIKVIDFGKAKHLAELPADQQETFKERDVNSLKDLIRLIADSGLHRINEYIRAKGGSTIREYPDERLMRLMEFTKDKADKDRLHPDFFTDKAHNIDEHLTAAEKEKIAKLGARSRSPSPSDHKDSTGKRHRRHVIMRDIEVYGAGYA